MVSQSDDDGDDVVGAAPRVRLSGLVLHRDGRARAGRRRQHQAHARPHPHRPVHRRDGADDRLVGRVEHDPGRRRDLVGAVAGDPAVPGVDRAVRGQQSASAVRRPAAVGGDGHARPRRRLARRGERQRSRGRPHRAARRSSPRRTGRDYSDIDVVRLADGRFLAVIREHQTRQSVWSTSADEGATWSPIRPTAVQGLEHQAVPPSLRRGRVRLPRRGTRAAWREPQPDRGWRRVMDRPGPALCRGTRGAPRTGERLRLPGHASTSVAASSARSCTATRRPTASSSTGCACATGPEASDRRSDRDGAVHLAVGVEVRPEPDLRRPRRGGPCPPTIGEHRHQPGRDGPADAVRVGELDRRLVDPQDGDVARVARAERSELGPAQDRRRLRAWSRRSTSGRDRPRAR